MDIIDIRRRKFAGMLAAALVAGTGGLLPFKSLAKPAARGWPLWSIRRGGRNLYLTAETPPQPADWRDSRIEQLLAHCSSFWTETNNVYRQPQGALIQRYGMDPKRPLDAWLDARDKARLARAASYCKTHLDDLAPYRPWIVGSLLQDQYYRVAGWKGKSAREVLAGQATRAGIPWHCEFETKDEVLAWFGALTPLQDVQFLRYVLDEVLAGPAADARIFEAWTMGRRGLAAAEVERYSRAYPELAQRLTFARNQAWLPRFEKMLDAPGTPLVVVGLYHMVGPSGLLASASRQGWTVDAL
ncbi:TraB/GumN family protein [Fulvimonas sp. R45]|uniref:TraB/GumN family protein n=1 Tax=Fulvimonas sp. R45 TaxID=3045937 RepID=UPI00265F0D44|nr:TraB/GumN family protein [Fulvimonas sp. R45]MDO1528190.1 TraB/GumN family protein [Fulvimonas sp. R45]